MKKKIQPRSEKSKYKKRVNKIWLSNKYKKPRASLRKFGKVIPVKEKCLQCGRKTKNHHVLCDRCWNIKKNFKRRKNKI